MIFCTDFACIGGSHVVFAQKRHAVNAVKATNGAVVYGKMLKVSLQRPFQKTTEPCRGFASGICRRGDMCRYVIVCISSFVCSVTMELR